MIIPDRVIIEDCVRESTIKLQVRYKYKTYSGLICVVKHVIYVIGIRRINPFIYVNRTGVICVIEPMIWFGCVE